MVQVKPFVLATRVRFSETDAYGVVYYANYFVYFEIARTEMLRSLGVTQHMAKERLLFLAAEASCKYRASAHYDELLQVFSWISEIGRRSVTYRHEIRRDQDGKVLVEGQVTDVLVDGKQQQPKLVPPTLRAKLEGALLHR